MIETLDLVIRVDSAVAHLAETVGKRTWVLWPFIPDWRWQLDREDSLLGIRQLEFFANVSLVIGKK